MCRSFLARMAGVACAAFLLICVGGGPCDAWEEKPAPPRNEACGVLGSAKITGTITDVRDVFLELPEHPPGRPDVVNSNSREGYRTQYTITLDLTATNDSVHTATSTLSGSAHVVWQKQTKFVYRQNGGACADGLLIDSNVREWTVNITGNTTCDGAYTWNITGSGMPDGSEIPETLRYHEDNCHPGCTELNCPDKTEPGSKHPFTWSLLNESGVFKDKMLVHRTNRTLDEGYQGEDYREVNLELKTN